MLQIKNGHVYAKGSVTDKSAPSEVVKLLREDFSRWASRVIPTGKQALKDTKDLQLLIKEGFFPLTPKEFRKIQREIKKGRTPEGKDFSAECLTELQKLINGTVEESKQSKSEESGDPEPTGDPKLPASESGDDPYSLKLDDVDPESGDPDKGGEEDSGAPEGDAKPEPDGAKKRGRPRKAEPKPEDDAAGSSEPEADA